MNTKIYLLWIMYSLGIAIAFGQVPANDSFSSAIPITGATGSATGNNLNATLESGEPTTTATFSAGKSVWYKWTAPLTGPITFSLTPAFEAQLSIYTGSALNGLIPKGQSDTNIEPGKPNVVELISLAAVQGQEYRVRITGRSSGSGSFTLRWQPPPSNDNYAEATRIDLQTGITTISDSNAGATGEIGETAFGFLIVQRRSVWYRVFAPKGFNVSLSTEGSTFDTFVSVYRQTSDEISGLSPVTGNDTSVAGQTYAKVSFVETESFGAYYIAVDGVNSETGNIRLTFTVRPPNDDLLTAQLLTPPPAGEATISSSNLGATVQAGEFLPPQLSGRSATHSVWFRILAPAGGFRFTLSATSTSFQPMISVYRGNSTASVSQLDPVIGNVYGGPYRTSKVTFQVVGSNTQDYWIAVDGRSETSGYFTLKFHAPPANDHFVNAELLVPEADGYSVKFGENYAATAELGETSYTGLDSPSGSIWFRLPSPPVGSTFMIDTYGSDFSPMVSIFRENSSQGLTQLNKIAGSSYGSRVAVTVPNSTGGDYFIAVDGRFYSGEGSEVGNIRLNLSTPPSNDNLAGAKVLEVGDGYPTDWIANIAATTETGESAYPGLGDPSHSVWYRIKSPPLGSSFTVSSDCNFDTVMTLYRGYAVGGASQLQVINGDDNSGGGLDSKLTFTVPDSSRKDYFIAVDGRDEQTGSIRLNLEAVRPSNQPSSSTASVFPAISAEPYEKFTEGSDAFDFDSHSITFVPRQVFVNGAFETHYHYTVHRIRELPEDLTDEILDDYLSNESAPAGFRIFGTPVSKFEMASDRVIGFRDDAGDLVISKIHLLSRNGQSESNRYETRVKRSSHKVTVQLDDYLSTDLGSNPPPSRGSAQVELFENGMIRLSFVGVEAENGLVGLYNGGAFPPEDNFSDARISLSDVVTSENAGTATFKLEFPTTVASFGVNSITSAGTALSALDFTAISQTTSLPVGSRSITVGVPLLGDSAPEADEYFKLKVTASGDPNWILAEAKGWIQDNLPSGITPAPRVSLIGNRVMVLPPPGVTNVAGFRIASVTGGTLRDPISGLILSGGVSFSLATGAAGILTSGPDVQFVVQSIATGSGLVLGSTPFDVDGRSSGSVFNFVRQVVNVVEGNTVEITVESTLSGAVVAYELVPGTAQATAAGGGDYFSIPATLEFSKGKSSISISILADGIKEHVEEFEVHLVNPSSGAFLGSRSIAKIIIADGNDALRSPSDQKFPNVSPSGRTVEVDFLNFPSDPNSIGSSDFTAGDLSAFWRFTGETRWRSYLESAWNTRNGFHQIEFRPSTGIAASSFKNLAHLGVSPLFLAPDSYLNQGIFQGSLSGVEVSYARSEWWGLTWPFGTTPAAYGALSVVLNAASPSTGRWRRLGESQWRSSSETENNVPFGNHLLEFKDDIAGFMAPTIRSARVWPNQLSTLNAAYQVRPVVTGLPSPVADTSLKQSGTTWVNLPITSQTTRFRASFEFQPQAGSLQTLLGFSKDRAAAETNLAAAMKVSAAGFQAKNGSAYSSAAIPNPVAGDWYFVEFDVNVAAATYSLTITPKIGGPIEISNGAAFPVALTEIRYVAMQSSQGSHKIRNLLVEDLPPSVPEWKAFKIPTQKSSFDFGCVLDIAFSESFVGSGAIQFGLSNGSSPTPTAQLNPQSANVRYLSIERTVVSVHVNLNQQTYSITVQNGAESGTLPLPVSLSQVDYVYIRIPYRGDQGLSSRLISVRETWFPPHVVAPSGPVNTSSNWLNIPIEPQTGRFSLTCDIVTDSETVGSGDHLIDGLVGLADTQVSWWTDIPFYVRAKLPISGTADWDARTGGQTSGSYIRNGDIPVIPGKRYKLDLLVDVPAQSYRATLQLETASPVVLVAQGTFQKSVTELRYLVLRNVQGRLSVSNLRVPLPPPEGAPAMFTGQIESSHGFGSGVVVADHVVLTTARLVFDTNKLTFVPDVVWRLPAGGGRSVADINKPSGILLITGYADGLLAAPNSGLAADRVDLALLAFRPLSLPEHDNAPGLGGYSGFMIDDGSAPWVASGSTKVLASFPMSGIPAEERGNLHRTDVSTASFSALSGPLRAVASNLLTPPGSEGAPLFVAQADGRYLPAAICLGSASGQPRFRAIDALVANAIYEANQYQRLPNYLQELLKAGVYFIPTTWAKSSEPNRAHIYSDAIPATASWALTRSGYSSIPAKGGDAVSVEAAAYTVTFGEAPTGFSGPNPATVTRFLQVGSRWDLPKDVYKPTSATSYQSWVNQNFDIFEAAIPSVSSASAFAPWSGTANLTAYAFGFDPNSTSQGNADPSIWKPGYPLVAIDRTTNPPTFKVECLRRLDPKLQYLIESSDSLAGSWGTIPNAPAVIKTQDGWDHARWTFQISTGQPGRKFIRTRVILNP